MSGGECTIFDSFCAKRLEDSEDIPYVVISFKVIVESTEITFATNCEFMCFCDHVRRECFNEPEIS